MTGQLDHPLCTADTSEYKCDRKELATHLPALHKAYTTTIHESLDLLEVYLLLHLTLKTSRDVDMYCHLKALKEPGNKSSLTPTLCTFQCSFPAKASLWIRPLGCASPRRFGKSKVMPLGCPANAETPKINSINCF